MIFCFRFSKPTCVLPSKFIYCFSSVTVSRYLFGRKKLSIYFGKYWVARRKCLSSFSLFGCFNCFIAGYLSCSGRIPAWLILRPIHSIFVLKKLDLVSLRLYPAYSSYVRTSISAFMCSFFEPFVTAMISSNQAECLFSNVWSIVSGKIVGISANT